MPYSLPIHSQGRAGHRRSYSHITTTTSPSLGDLPRRRSSSNIPQHYPAAAAATPKKPTFHFRQDEDEDDDNDDDQRRAIHNDNDDDDDDDDDEKGRLHGLPPLRLKFNSTSFNAVPFPRSSPLCSPPLPRPSPTISRTSSSTQLLSNGKPLKSSLKSSSSSPNIPFPSQSLVPSIMFPDLHPGYYKQQQQQQQLPQHQRAQSAPCTPLIDGIPSPLSTSPSISRSPSPPHSPSLHQHHHHHHPPKNVHFPSQEEGGLATIRVFNKSARPASLSRLGEETETETEGEGSGAGGGGGLYGSGGWAGWSGKYVGGSTYPFPRVAATAANSEKKSPLNPSVQQRQERIPYDIDWSQSSIIPRKNVHENVFFESLQVVDSDSTLYFLQGTLLVRNITYQKTVMVRYTMDEWETVNDVVGWYDVGGVSGGNGDRGGGSDWDRFKFSISLEEGSQELEKRIVYLVGRYVGGKGASASANGGGADGAMGEGGTGAGEWWDNNEGRNYKVAFRKILVAEQEVAAEKGKEAEKEKPYKRGVVVSAPPSYMSPTPTLTRQKLSAPQISSSSSFPSTRFSAQYQYQQQQQQERERERERAQHQAALTESTLARLKKLNLKNYAAPRGYAYGQQTSSSSVTMAAAAPVEEHLPIPPVLTLTSASPTNSSFVAGSGSPRSHSPPMVEESSPIAPTNLSLNTTMEVLSSPTLSTSSTASTTDSTPVQTPTQEDDDDDDEDESWRRKGDGEEDPQNNRNLRWSLRMEHGHFATTIITPPLAPPPPPPAINGSSGLTSSTPTAIPYTRTSYPYTTNVGGVEMGTSPPFSDLAGSVGGMARGGGGPVHWDWGSAAGATLSGGGGEKKEGWMGYQQHPSSVGGGLMPPQRKRGLHHPQQRRGNEGSLSVSSSSGSGSDSHSSTTLGSTLPAAAAPSLAFPSSSPPSSSSSSSSPSLNPTAAPSSSSIPPPKQQKPTPLKLKLPSATLTQPIATGGVQSPFCPGSARRGLGGGYYHHPPQQHRHFQPTTTISSVAAAAATTATHHHPPNNNNSPPSPGSASNDAIYQALVREWCFAQGPAPVVGSIGVLSSSSSSGETTPVVGRLASPLE